jgi:predicted HAD superfamily Cof-like phosphohydrolase
MTQEQRNVLEFHRTFGLTVNEKPTEPSVADRILRAKLLFEEVMETIHALGVKVVACDQSTGDEVYSDASGTAFEFYQSPIHKFDIVGVADGLGDTKYVADGCAVTCGIDLEPVCAEIQRSNMSKLWTTAETTAMPEGSSATAVRSSGSPFDRVLVVKRVDGKVLKSPSYSPANLAPILEQQSK